VPLSIANKKNTGQQQRSNGAEKQEAEVKKEADEPRKEVEAPEPEGKPADEKPSNGEVKTIDPSEVCHAILHLHGAY
jgi:hypothetical protein